MPAAAAASSRPASLNHWIPRRRTRSARAAREPTAPYRVSPYVLAVHATQIAQGAIVTDLGEALDPPPVSPAGGPPTERGGLVQVHHHHAVFQATETLRADARKTQLQQGKPRISRTPFWGPGDGGTRLTSRYTPSVIRSRVILNRLDRLGNGSTSPRLDFKTAKTTHPV